jgi:hypothetical protein
MQLVSSLTEQLGGTLELIPHEGTHVRVRFATSAGLGAKAPAFTSTSPPAG